MKKNLFVMMFALLAILLVACGDSDDNGGNAADNYPNKPIEFIVQYGAGGATDLVYRPVLQEIAKELGGTIVVKNVTEGGGIQGAQQIANADPDGYTAGVLSAGQTVMAPLFREVPVSLEDFEIVGSVGAYLYGLIAPKDAPYDDFEGFVEYLKANDGKLVASTIPSNVYEIFYAWLRKEYGVEFSTLPFDSAADTSMAVQNGSAHFSVGLTSVDNARIQAGEIKLIAALGDTRWPVAPDVPTLQESGYPDVMVATILGIGLPKGTPEAIRQKWESALEKVLQKEDIVDKLVNLSTEPAFKKGDEFKDYLNELDTAFKTMLGK